MVATVETPPITYTYKSLIEKSIELAKQQKLKKEHPFKLFGAQDLFKIISDNVDLPSDVEVKKDK